MLKNLTTLIKVIQFFISLGLSKVLFNIKINISTLLRNAMILCQEMIIYLCTLHTRTGKNYDHFK